MAASIDHDARFRTIRRIVNHQDPARLLEDRTSSWNGSEWGPFDRVNDDEYDSEVKGILRILQSSSDEKNCRYRLHQLFHTMFDARMYAADRCDSLSAELWRVSREKGW